MRSANSKSQPSNQFHRHNQAPPTCVLVPEKTSLVSIMILMISPCLFLRVWMSVFSCCQSA